MTIAEPAQLDQLRGDLRGRVVDPTESEYDDLRTLFAGGFDRRPAAIVRPSDTDDVARAVTRARDAGLDIAVRGGGHSAAGHSVPDGAVVLDLRDMRGLEIDVESRTAWAEAGLSAGEFTRAAGAHGLATGFGDTGSVGISGITLGGGIGFLSRLHGMTIDSVLAADVVTADGEVLRVDTENHPDLFWALRGGGGNFGVVTRFKYKLAEVPEVTGGILLLPAAGDTLADFLALAEKAPRELSVILNVMPAPPLPFVDPQHHGRIALMALICCAAPAAEAEAILAPFRALAEPLADMVRPTAYPELFPPEPDDFHPAAVIRTSFTGSVDAALAADVIGEIESSDAPMRVAQFRVLGGAIADIPSDATAYAHRDAEMMVNVASFYAGPEEKAKRRDWVNALSAKLDRGHPGAYVNFLGEDGPERIGAAYPGATRERLVAVKRRYDPSNVFRWNHNVAPD